jgi:hypothetical protein
MPGAQARQRPLTSTFSSGKPPIAFSMSLLQHLTRLTFDLPIPHELGRDRAPALRREIQPDAEPPAGLLRVQRHQRDGLDGRGREREHELRARPRRAVQPPAAVAELDRDAVRERVCGRDERARIQSVVWRRRAGCRCGCLRRLGLGHTVYASSRIGHGVFRGRASPCHPDRSSTRCTCRPRAFPAPFAHRVDASSVFLSTSPCPPRPRMQ